MSHLADFTIVSIVRLQGYLHESHGGLQILNSLLLSPHLATHTLQDHSAHEILGELLSSLLLSLKVALSRFILIGLDQL